MLIGGFLQICLTSLDCWNALILVQSIVKMHTDLKEERRIENADDNGASLNSDLHFISLAVKQKKMNIIK